MVLFFLVFLQFLIQDYSYTQLTSVQFTWWLTFRSISRRCISQKLQDILPVDHSLNLLLSSCQSVESLPPTLRPGNLSVLKKRWEQPAPRQDKPSLLPAGPPRARLIPPAVPKPVPPTEHRPPAKSPGSPGTQGSQDTAASCFQYPLAAIAKEGAERRMERKDQRPSEGEEEEGLMHVEGKVVPPSPCSPVEKPSVPLNSLKMMFEKGEGTKGKVRLIRHIHSGYVSLYTVSFPLSSNDTSLSHSVSWHLPQHVAAPHSCGVRSVICV